MADEGSIQQVLHKILVGWDDYSNTTSYMPVTDVKLTNTNVIVIGTSRESGKTVRQSIPHEVFDRLIEHKKVTHRFRHGGSIILEEFRLIDK